MNADLTFNTIVFKKSFDDAEGSIRQSTVRGINTPDKLVIRRQARNSKTNGPSQAYSFKVELHSVDAAGVKRIAVSANVTLDVADFAVQANVDNVVATLKAAVADATFIPAVLNGE